MKILEQITVYPIKSLGGINLEKATITSGGSLQHDREFALVDAEGKFISGKKFAQIHLIKPRYLLDETLVELSIKGESFKKVFHLEKEKAAIEKFFSDFLERQVFFQQNKNSGFPDDLSASGPTVVSSASLKEVATWFPEISVDELYRRFRPNLLLTNTPAFWEDNLFGELDEEISFQIGEIKFLGINPCARCVVPTKNPESGEAIPLFQKHFSEMRKATLPKWSTLSRFDHYYRFCVNTKIPLTESGKTLFAQTAVSLNPKQ